MKVRVGVFVATLSLLAAVAASAVPLAGASRTTSEQSEVVSREAIALAKKFSVSEDEMSDRLAREAEIVELQTRARERYGESFTGVWVDHARGGTVHVAATGIEPAHEYLYWAPQVSFPGLLQVHAASLSWSGMELLHQRMGKAKADLVAAGIPPFAVGTNLAESSVEVTPTRELEAEEQAAIQEAAGDMQSELTFAPPSPPGADEACNNRMDCAPALRGGIALDHTNTAPNYDCTSSFSVVNGTGTKSLVTAGHCLAAGTNNWEHNDVNFGDMVEVVDQGSSDFGRIRITNSWGVQDWYFISNEINSVQELSAQFTGQGVCISGVTTGVSCGVIVDRLWDPPTGNNSNLIKTDYCAQGGDSGAPVYLSSIPARIAGVHSQDANEPGNTCPQAADRSAYAHVGHLHDALGVNVLLD